MTSSEMSAKLDPAARYALRMREMAEQDAQIRNLVPDPAVHESLWQPGISLADIIARVLAGYAGRPAMGERRYEVVEGAATGKHVRRYGDDFATITYGEVRDRVEGLASAWRHHPHHRVGAGDALCVFGNTSSDFAIIEMAAVYAQAVSVPLQTTLAGTELDRILSEVRPVAVATTLTDLDVVTPLVIGHGGIRSLVVFDCDGRVDGEREQFESARARIAGAGANTHLIALQDLIASAQPGSWQPLPPHPQGLARMASIIHSSGSTGAPKGVIIPECASRLAWAGTQAQQVLLPVIAMAYAPLNHFMGRTQVFGTLAKGGTVYFTLKPDLSTLFEDIRIARPTFMSFFPRIFELVYQYYQGEVLRRTAAGEGDRDTVDALVRAEMRNSFLGDRLRAGQIASAPTAPEVREFVRECFDIQLNEGYGSTEAGLLVAINGMVQRPPVLDYRLRDVPELGYYKTDKPYPRGELCIRSELQTPGYFNNADATAALFDEDGYVMTGDIVQEIGPNQIAVIDRRNDVLKLSQAEFVAVGRLGTLFEGGSAVIRQIFIYGNSSRAYLLAVVVPDMDVVTARLGTNVPEADLKALIRTEMQLVAQNEKLRTFEVPRDFLIEMEPFSHENGLLSSVRKRMRPKFIARYGERLDALYQQIEGKRHEELLALRDPASPLTVLEKVVKALEASLGIEDIDPATTQTFAELGGDSIGAASFSLFLKDIFGVELPVNAIVSPAGNPGRWAEAISNLLSTDRPALPTFDSVHGAGARVIHGADLQINKFLGQDILDNLPREAPPETPRTVLLTGANGFLGRFLCLTWLERLSANNGKLICLIRGADSNAARRRLDQVFTGVDQELEDRYRALAASHLEVLAGDVAEASLGLSGADWNRLAAEVDQIVHPAALVNHVLPYEHLFGPNVLGTAELIRLALTRRLKRFDFVSSLAAANWVDETRGNNEDSPLLDSIPLRDHYAAGYGASKWANEIMLHSAHRQAGLPVNIFRGDMILPHTRYKGQINVPDMITRLLYSIVITGLAPESFYERADDGSRVKAHYDGLPVDYIAEAMFDICGQPNSGVRTFNVINYHHGDGISLDSFVDWIISAGYPVERVADHDQWLERFRAKLGTLTEAQRQRSSLAILEFVSKPFPAHPRPRGSGHFEEAIRQLPIGPEVPHLSEAYIHKYLKDIELLGMFKS